MATDSSAAAAPGSQGPERHPALDRRHVLTAGAAGIVTVVLPSAMAAATGGQALALSGTLTFSDVTDTGFTVSWTGV